MISSEKSATFRDHALEMNRVAELAYQTHHVPIRPERICSAGEMPPSSFCGAKIHCRALFGS